MAMTSSSLLFALLCCLALTFVVALVLRRLRIMALLRRRQPPPAEALVLEQPALIISFPGRGLDEESGLSEAAIEALGQAGQYEVLRAKGPWQEQTTGAWAQSRSGLEAGAPQADQGEERGVPGAARECTVCLGDFQSSDLVRVLPCCGNCFHKACIDSWLRSKPSCPLCRTGLGKSSSDTQGPPLPPPSREAPQEAISE